MKKYAIYDKEHHNFAKICHTFDEAMDEMLILCYGRTDYPYIKIDISLQFYCRNDLRAELGVYELQILHDLT